MYLFPTTRVRLTIARGRVRVDGVRRVSLEAINLPCPPTFWFGGLRSEGNIPCFIELCQGLCVKLKEKNRYEKTASRKYGAAFCVKVLN